MSTFPQLERRIKELTPYEMRVVLLYCAVYQKPVTLWTLEHALELARDAVLRKMRVPE